MKIVNVFGVDYAVNLKWTSALGQLTEDDKNSHIEKNSNCGLIVKGTDQEALGLLANADDYRGGMMSFAAIAADYLPNSVFCFKFLIDNDYYYWSCLSSGGIPVIDQLASDMDESLTPILERLNDKASGNQLLNEGKVCFLFSKDLNEEIDSSEIAQNILIKRKKLEKNFISTEEFSPNKKYLISTKVGSSGFTISREHFQIIALITTIIAALWYFTTEEKVEIKSFIPTKIVASVDYKKEYIRVVKNSFYGMDKIYTSSVFNYIWDFPPIVSGFKLDNMECQLSSKTNCVIQYKKLGLASEADQLIKYFSNEQFYDLEFSKDFETFRVKTDITNAKYFSGFSDFDYGFYIIDSLSKFESSRFGVVVDIGDHQEINIGSEADRELFGNKVGVLNLNRYSFQVSGKNKNQADELLEIIHNRSSSVERIRYSPNEIFLWQINIVNITKNKSGDISL
jgi:hypothetical protein